MDHTGGYFMAIAILAALYHRARTGEGQWVDMSCTEAGAALIGPAVLDYTVNGRPLRRDGMPNSQPQPVAGDGPPRHLPTASEPAGTTAGRGHWVAIACRDDDDWRRWSTRIGGAGWATAGPATSACHRWPAAWPTRTSSTRSSPLDRHPGPLRAGRGAAGPGVPAAAVARPGERIDDDPTTAAWGLWPTVDAPAMGEVRVDGLPVHLRRPTGASSGAPPCLGQHNERCSARSSACRPTEIDELRAEGVI